MAVSSAALSQQAPYALLQPASVGPAAATTALTSAPLPEPPQNHRFWDRENSILFAANLAFSAGDFVVTRDNLRSGGRELNPVTRVFSGSTAGLAVNFAGENAAVAGLSYLFHKRGHHRLERAVSVINLAGSAGAVTFDLRHK